MVAIYRCWRSQGHLGQAFFMNIEHVYAQYFTHVNPNCVHSACCGGNLVMEPDGSLYACYDMIDAKHRLGRFDNGIEFAGYVDAAIGMDLVKPRACGANARVVV
ncbi:hypothetical protein ACMV5I_14805 [Serratia sp. T13T92]|uniref:hypothetical protein n=1 Tax=Serratia sp. T13T92 TaxID=3397496 RepID=UPI0039E0F3B4